MAGTLGKLKAGRPDAPAPFGDFWLLGLLARGGMAEVYLARAHDAPLGDAAGLLAVKVMQPRLAKEARFAQMFEREAQLAMLLQNPCVVRTHRVGQHGGRAFIAMEYVAGRDLNQLLRRLQETGARMPVPHAVYIAARIAEGLAYAHALRAPDGGPLNIVNRDVSPSNVRLSYQGDVKLIDFGIAQALMAFTSEIGVLKGKFSYMSPEQIRGMPLDARTDVFSTGIILHEMLTGEKLFRGDTEFALMEKVRDATVAPPSQWNPKVPRELDAIVLRALARDVADRYQTAAQLASDLDLLAAGYRFRASELRQLVRQTFRQECAAELAAAQQAASSPPPSGDGAGLADVEGFEDAEHIDEALDADLIDELEPEIEAAGDDGADADAAAAVRGSQVDAGAQVTQPEGQPGRRSRGISAGGGRRSSGRTSPQRSAGRQPSATPVTGPARRRPTGPAPLPAQVPSPLPSQFTGTGVLVRPPTAPFAKVEPDAPARSLLGGLLRRKPRP